MSCNNPTGEGRAVPLRIPAGNEAFLRRVVGAARDGIREELDRFGDQLQTPGGQLRLEEVAYSALLDGLDHGRIVPDEAVVAAVAQLAEALDRDNDYGRVVAEHDALQGLLLQLEGRVA